MKSGTVYLVGAGPGDPGLLTVKGHTLLRRADVVVYDHLVAPEILKACPSRAKLVYVGKTAGQHTLTQDAMNALLVREARAGHMVVRLKGGDPVVFGRGGEEALALAKARVPFEIVPGVTSAFAVPAYAGIPVTHRRLSSSVAVATGHEDPGKASTAIRWDALATGCDTLIFLMGVSTLPGLVATLLRHGRKAQTPCAVIEWGTRPHQRTVTGTLRTIVGAVRRAAIGPPAVLIVGEVVSLRKRLNWFETKPLFGTRVLVTRASDKAASLIEQLEALGAEVVALPAIELAPVKSNGLLRRVVRDAPKPDWVFFTSPEGIGWFARMLKPYRKDVRWLSGCHIGAIGPKTAAAIEERGVHVDVIPKQFSQEGMIDALPRRMVRGKRALILSARESRDVLAAGLRAHGMVVTKVPVYQTIIPTRLMQQAGRVLREPCDLVTVTSASCVEHLAQALHAAGLRRRLAQLRFASIGPVTSQAVRAHGGCVVVEAKTSTVEGLVEAIARKGQAR